MLLAGLAILAAGVGGLLWWQSNASSQKACTLEAKLCPDGSYVGRSGPNCEFATCPTSTGETANWKTYVSERLNFEIKYPPDWFLSEDRLTSFDVETAKKGNFPEEPFAKCNFVNYDPPLFNVKSEKIVRGSSPKITKQAVNDKTFPPQSNEEIFDLYLISQENHQRIGFWCTSFDKTFTRTISQILSTFKFLNRGDSGIYGKVSVGPTCPVQRQGEVCEKAYVGTVVIMKSGPITDPTSLEEFTRFQTDQNGNFRLSLPAGDYIALPYPKNAITFSKTQIHVEENKFSEVNITFDTGIR